MEKDSEKSPNLAKLKASIISSPSHPHDHKTGTTCKPKKEKSVVLTKEVVSNILRDESIEVVLIDPTLNDKNNIEKKDERKDLSQKAATETSEETSPKTTKSRNDIVPVIENREQGPANVAVPRRQAPLPPPILNIRPLVMAVHLVPSLPISLFEILAEAIEAATGKPVVLLYEARADRPVAQEVADIAILPTSHDWPEGVLLPASFVFEHRMNKEFLPHIYGDVVVASDRVAQVESIQDLRGHQCALPDRRRPIGTAGLLFTYLKSKGEGPAFFGNILDVDSQMAALQMIAGKQVEVGILESPVLKYHRNFLPGVERLDILTSLGPLPPYRIMVHRDMPAPLVRKITTYLLNVKNSTEWMEKFSPYSVLGFAENLKSYYDLNEIKSVVTSVPYY